MATPNLMTSTPWELGTEALAPSFEAGWYVAYTSARHEKAVARQLDARKVDTFLPLYQAVHFWKGRRAEVQVPLFPGYVFLRVSLHERLRVLQVPGLVHLVGIRGRPTLVADSEIEALRQLCSHARALPHPFLAIGRRARVRSGPLEGLEGLVVRRKGSLRFVLSITLIQRSIAVEMDAADLEPASDARQTAAGKKVDCRCF